MSKDKRNIDENKLREQKKFQILNQFLSNMQYKRSVIFEPGNNEKKKILNIKKMPLKDKSGDLQRNSSIIEKGSITPQMDILKDMVKLKRSISHPQKPSIEVQNVSINRNQEGFRAFDFTKKSDLKGILQLLKKNNQNFLEIAILKKALEGIEFFDQCRVALSKMGYTQLIKNLKAQFVPSGGIVFKDGEVGEQFYVVLSGETLLLLKSEANTSASKQDKILNQAEKQVNQSPRRHIYSETQSVLTQDYYHQLHQYQSIEDGGPVILGDLSDISKHFPNHQIVSYIQPGQTFGETAIINASRRTSLVIATQDSHLLSIDQEFYLQILIQFQQSISQDKLNFIKQFSVLEQLDQKLTTLVYCFEDRVYNRGEVIFCEQDKPSEIFFIQSGEIEISKLVEEPSQDNPNNLPIPQGEKLNLQKQIKKRKTAQEIQDENMPKLVIKQNKEKYLAGFPATSEVYDEYFSKMEFQENLNIEKLNEDVVYDQRADFFQAVTQNSLQQKKIESQSEKKQYNTILNLGTLTYFGEQDILMDNQHRSVRAVVKSATAEILILSKENLKLISQYTDIWQKMRQNAEMKEHWRAFYLSRVQDTRTFLQTSSKIDENYNSNNKNRRSRYQQNGESQTYTDFKMMNFSLEKTASGQREKEKIIQKSNSKVLSLNNSLELTNITSKPIQSKQSHTFYESKQFLKSKESLDPQGMHESLESQQYLNKSSNKMRLIAYSNVNKDSFQLSPKPKKNQGQAESSIINIKDEHTPEQEVNNNNEISNKNLPTIITQINLNQIATEDINKKHTQVDSSKKGVEPLILESPLQEGQLNQMNLQFQIPQTQKLNQQHLIQSNLASSLEQIRQVISQDNRSVSNNLMTNNNTQISISRNLQIQSQSIDRESEKQNQGNSVRIPLLNYSPETQLSPRTNLNTEREPKNHFNQTNFPLTQRRPKLVEQPQELSYRDIIHLREKGTTKQNFYLPRIGGGPTEFSGQKPRFNLSTKLSPHEMLTTGHNFHLSSMNITNGNTDQIPSSRSGLSRNEQINETLIRLYNRPEPITRTGYISSRSNCPDYSLAIDSSVPQAINNRDSNLDKLAFGNKDDLKNNAMIHSYFMKANPQHHKDIVKRFIPKLRKYNNMQEIEKRLKLMDMTEDQKKKYLSDEKIQGDDSGSNKHPMHSVAEVQHTSTQFYETNNKMKPEPFFAKQQKDYKKAQEALKQEQQKKLRSQSLIEEKIKQFTNQVLNDSLQNNHTLEHKLSQNIQRGLEEEIKEKYQNFVQLYRVLNMKKVISSETGTAFDKQDELLRRAMQKERIQNSHSQDQNGHDVNFYDFYERVQYQIKKSKFKKPLKPVLDREPKVYGKYGTSFYPQK